MENIIDKNALYKISYGLFVLTACENDFHNGCIVNTVQQVTDSPKRIAVTVNKANLTHDMIKNTGFFNVSVISEDSDFEIFKHFGFSSGRDVNKFENYEHFFSENGLYYVKKGINSYFSAKVISETDCGTHTLFIADVTHAEVISDVPSMTYDYYFKNVKPAPEAKKEKSSYVCKICGYVYEGDELPADFVCPWCKHGAEDFEKM